MPDVEFQFTNVHNKDEKSQTTFPKSLTIAEVLEQSEDKLIIPLYKKKSNINYECNGEKITSLNKIINNENNIIKMTPKYEKLNLVFNFKPTYSEPCTFKKNNVSFLEILENLKSFVISEIQKIDIKKLGLETPLVDNNCDKIIFKQKKVKVNANEFLHDLDWKNNSTLEFDVFLNIENTKLNRWKP